MKVIIFDFFRTLYDPEQDALFRDAKNVLGFLKQSGYILYLYGKGDEKRGDLIEKCDIRDFFEDIIVKEEKSLIDMGNIIKKHPKAEFFAVGDRIKKEIMLANQCGMKTIWFKNGKFANEIPETREEMPHWTISDLIELKKNIFGHEIDD